LGGAKRREVPIYASHPLGSTPEESAGFAAEICDRGFRAVKFGWHPLGQDGPSDEAIVRALRRAIGEDRELLIDGGLAYDAETAIERCRRFAPYRLFWLEEPLAPYDFAGYARLTAATETPIAAGEMASTAAELTRLIEEGGIDIVQVDIARVGLTQAMKVAEAAARRGLPCVNHTYSYGINLAASLHFVCAIEQTSLFEYQVTPNEIRDVLVPNVPRPVDGMLRVPDGPGLGIDIDPAALERFAVRD
jgi:L-alanine-DL-glutamate epimerase-like enolase superfamily enzyme